MYAGEHPCDARNRETHAANTAHVMSGEIHVEHPLGDLDLAADQWSLSLRNSFERAQGPQREVLG